jgi:hypothetical protein
MHSARSVFICFVLISEQTVNFDLHKIQELVFITEIASGSLKGTDNVSSINS